MFYNQDKCIKMIKDTYINFNIVFKWRTEIKFDNMFSILEFKNNTVYIPSEKDYGGLNDQIAYGDLESMIKYSDTYNHLEYLTQIRNIYIHPETLLMNNCNEHNLNIIRFDFDYYLQR